jgi:hypothetical protein
VLRLHAPINHLPLVLDLERSAASLPTSLNNLSHNLCNTTELNGLSSTSKQCGASANSH